MYKIVILFFCLLFFGPDLAPAQASETTSTTSIMESSSTPVPRPNYKRYRGNSRSKARRIGPFRRWKLRRKAQRKKRATPAPRRGVISVDAPKGTMNK